MFSVRRQIFLVTALTAMLAASPAFAQGLFGNSGTTGTTAGRTGTTTGGTAGGLTAGRTGATGVTSGTGAQLGNLGDASARVMGNTGFLGQGASGTNGQGFVGRGNAQQQGANGQTGANGARGATTQRGQTRGANRNGTNANRNNANNGAQTGQGADTGALSSEKQTVRPQYKIAFDEVATAGSSPGVSEKSNVVTRLETSFARSPRFSEVKLELADAGILVLNGEVESESQKKLAETMARMEPGVRTVENRLLVRVGQPQ